MNLAEIVPGVHRCETCGSLDKSTRVGLAAAVAGREQDFPMLALALKSAVPATSPKIEWIVAGAVAENFCQIFRVPYSEKNFTQYGDSQPIDSAAGALTEMLLHLEQTMLFGKPQSWDMEIKQAGTCGGVYHYLGRLPTEKDVVSLRILRDLTFLAARQAPDMDDTVNEWLCEISLQVAPG